MAETVNRHGENRIGDLGCLREPGGGDDENLGSPGVGMHCWLEDVALVAAEVEDNANVRPVRNMWFTRESAVELSVLLRPDDGGS